MDKKNRSGRGPNIPGNVKKLIAQIYVENRHQTAKEVMTELHKQLKKNWGQDWPPGWPGISAVQKELEKFRNKSDDNDDEDKPWGHIALSIYPLPPDTIPIIYRVWAYSMRKDKPLTIRQAKWASYLSHLYTKKDIVSDKAIGELWTTACAAASREKVLKLTGGLPAKYDDMLWYWLEDAHLYSVLSGDGSLMNKFNDEYGAKEKPDKSQNQNIGEDDAGKIEWSLTETSKRYQAKIEEGGR